MRDVSLLQPLWEEAESKAPSVNQIMGYMDKRLNQRQNWKLVGVWSGLAVLFVWSVLRLYWEAVERSAGEIFKNIADGFNGWSGQYLSYAVTSLAEAIPWTATVTLLVVVAGGVLLVRSIRRYPQTYGLAGKALAVGLLVFLPFSSAHASLFDWMSVKQDKKVIMVKRPSMPVISGESGIVPVADMHVVEERVIEYKEEKTFASRVVVVRVNADKQELLLEGHLPDYLDNDENIKYLRQVLGKESGFYVRYDNNTAFVRRSLPYDPAELHAGDRLNISLLYLEPVVGGEAPILWLKRAVVTALGRR
ncbi:MAG: hypothetical protein V1707_00235 [bacterium]